MGAQLAHTIDLMFVTLIFGLYLMMNRQRVFRYDFNYRFGVEPFQAGLHTLDRLFKKRRVQGALESKEDMVVGVWRLR